LVEVCPWNLVTYSNDITNAIWVKVAGNGGTAPIVTANYATSPSGLNDATRIQLARTTTTDSFSVIRQAVTILPNTNYRQSVWLKSLSGTPTIFIADNGNFGTQFLVTLTTDWVRYELPFSNPFDFCNFDFALFQGVAGSSLSADFLVYGAQLNIGSTAKPYFPTTDRLNVPRLTYQNGGGGCPSLLLEKQSTNLLTYSQDFSQASWNKLGQGVASTPVLTANYAISPDGTQNATRFVCNLNGGTSSSDRSWMVQSFTAPATSTISIWIKLNSAGTKTLVFSDSGGGTKTISGTDWQRIDGTFVGAGGEFRIGLIGGTGSSDTLDCYIWGAQAEGGSYATSYIPTTSASATRVADLSATSTIQTAQTFAGDFTIFADFVPFIGASNADGLMILGGGVGGSGVSYQSYLWFVSNVVNLSGDGETQIIVRNYSMVANQRVKVAITRVGTTVKMFINGAQVGASATSSTSITIRSIGWSYNLATYRTQGKINQILLSASGASDTDAISLTTI
jgi:hypothetical protein